jgi:hypothetical protein
MKVLGELHKAERGSSSAAPENSSRLRRTNDRMHAVSRGCRTGYIQKQGAACVEKPSTKRLEGSCGRFQSDGHLIDWPAQ